MGDATHISWADRTWSPWTGCARVSPACDGCYAAHMMDTRMHRVEWGEPGAGGGTRDLMSDAYWRKPLAWDREAAKTGVRPWVFPSLCDPFDTAVPPPWRWRLVGLMEATPNVLWLLLTKRIGNVRKLTDSARGERPLPPNHALGATFANQAEWDRDFRKLREAADTTGALFSFGSFEPLLGSIDFGGGWMPGWVITGGETGQGSHKARPSHPDWFRSIRDQCAANGVVYHHKQNGEWLDEAVATRSGHAPGPSMFDRYGSPKGPKWYPYEASDRNGGAMIRIGKRAAGRTLDGIIHDARPTLPGARP